jgi:hypothetical protein
VLNLASICLILFSKVEGKKKKKKKKNNTTTNNNKKTLKNMLENPSKLQKNKIIKKNL